MGMLVGGLYAGYVADQFGRKAALLGSLGVNFLAGACDIYCVDELSQRGDDLCVHV
jgi:MFS family permease